MAAPVISTIPGSWQGCQSKAFSAATEDTFTADQPYVVTRVAFNFGGAALTTGTVRIEGGGQTIYSGRDIPYRNLQQPSSDVGVAGAQYSSLVWVPPMPLVFDRDRPLKFKSSIAVEITIDAVPVSG